MARPGVILWLRSLSARRKAAELAAGLLLFFGRFLLYALLLGSLDFLTAPGRSLRIVFQILFGLLLSFEAARLVTRRLLRRTRPLETALLLDDRKDTGDVFLNAWELHGRPEADPFVSGLIREAEQRRKETRLRDWFDPRPFFRALVFFSVLAGLVSAGFFFFPRDLLYHGIRTLAPRSGREAGLFSFGYSVSPGSARLPAGSECLVVLSVSEPLASCRITASGSRKERISGEMTYLSNAGPTNRYLFRFRELNESVRYSFRMVSRKKRREVETGFYDITVLHPPVLKDFTVRYAYPSHTGIKPLVRSGVPELEAPAGTSVRITATASQPLETAWFVSDDFIRPAEVKDSTLSVSVVLRSEGEYLFRLRGRNGMTNPSPARYAIRLIPDRPPAVSIPRPGRDIMVPTGMRFGLSVEARDDFRIRTLELLTFRQEAYGGRFFPTNRILLARDAGAGGVPVRVERVIDLDKEGLSPGETFYYYAVADDGHPSGEHRIASAVYAVRFPSLEDFYRKADRSMDENLSVLKRAREAQEEFLKRTDEMRRMMESGNTPDYTGKKQMESMLERQKELAEALRNASVEMEETVASMRQEKSHSSEIAAKMQEIQRIMQEVADQEMMRSIRDMEALLEKVDLSEEERRSLGDRMDQENLLRKLDNTIKMLEEVRAARKMSELARRADRLVERQREINEKTEESGDLSGEDLQKDLAARQEENRKSLGELQKEMDSFAAEQAGRDPAASEDVRKAGEELRKDDPAGEMRAASDAVKKKDREASREKQNKALSGLMNLQKNLQSASRKKNREDREDTSRLIGEIFFQIAGLASEQGRLVGEFSVPERASLSGTGEPIGEVFPSPSVRVDQSVPRPEQLVVLEKLLAGLKRTIRQELEKAAYVSDEFYAWFDEAQDRMIAARGQLDRGSVSGAAVEGRKTLAILNRIMLQFLDLAEQMNEQGESSSEGEGQEGMEGLSSSQESLNKSTQRMAGRRGSQGLSSADQSLLKELAYQQEMIKSAFQDLIQGQESGSGEPGQEGEQGEQGEKGQQGGQGLLGDMDSIAREMEEAIRKMQSGEVNEDLIRKQNRILQKMLDSQRALKTKEESPERKAEQAGRTPAAVTPPVDAVEALRRKAAEEAARERYPGEYREIIERYMRMLKE